MTTRDPSASSSWASSHCSDSIRARAGWSNRSMASSCIHSSGESRTPPSSATIRSARRGLARPGQPTHEDEAGAAHRSGPYAAGVTDTTALVAERVDELLDKLDPKVGRPRRVPGPAVRPRPGLGPLPRGARRPRRRRRTTSGIVDAAPARGRRHGPRAPSSSSASRWPGPTVVTHGSDELRGPAAPPDVHRRGRLVPALQRAGRRLRPRRPRLPGGPRRRRVGRSPARRCGTRSPTSPTGACSSPAPTPTRPSTRASPTSPSTCTRPASRSGRCARSPARPSSTRCTSPRCGCPTPTASATWATAGGSP